MKKELPMETAVQRANRIKSEYNLDSVDFIDAKIPVIECKEIDKEQRTVIKYVSKPTLDRSNEIVIQQGIDLKDFQKNPIILYAHNYGNSWMDGGNPVLPVGKDLWIKADDNGLLAKQKYASHQLANDLFNMHVDGFPLASSIGFIPTKTLFKGSFEAKDWGKEVGRLSETYGINKDNFKYARIIYENSLLLEHSDVPVPSNPDALALSIKSGDISIKSPELQQIFENAILRKEFEEMKDHAKILIAQISEMSIKPAAQQKGITKSYIEKRIIDVFTTSMKRLTGEL